MVFAYVFVKGWIIDPYVQCFFDCSTEVLVFPPNYIEIINSDLVTTDVTMVKYWGGCLLMFLEPLCKSSRGFTNVFLITVNPATLTPIDDPTLFEDWIFILGAIRRLLMVLPPLKYTCMPCLLQVFFEALTQTLMIGYHHVGLWALVVVVASVFSLCSFLLGLWS